MAQMSYVAIVQITFLICIMCNAVKFFIAAWENSTVMIGALIAVNLCLCLVICVTAVLFTGHVRNTEGSD